MKIKGVILFKREIFLFTLPSEIMEFCFVCKDIIGKENYYFVTCDIGTVRIHKRCACKVKELQEYLFIKLLEK